MNTVHYQVQCAFRTTEQKKHLIRIIAAIENTSVNTLLNTLIDERIQQHHSNAQVSALLKNFE